MKIMWDNYNRVLVHRTENQSFARKQNDKLKTMKNTEKIES